MSGGDTNDKVLVVSGLSRHFGSLEALRAVDLQVRRHEFVAIVGPSGCGKTTLLNILSGYERATTGSVTRQGRVRMVYQKDGLFPWLTAGENVLLGLRDVPDTMERRRRLDDLLGLIGLPRFADHYPHQLSGGMRQLVELARALAGESEILLMDEPFSSLDYIARLRMRQELARLLAERPRTVLFVTHDIEEAAQLADRVVVLTERPGRVCRALQVELPRPRSLTHPLVVEAIHTVLAEMGLESNSSPRRNGASGNRQKA
ncbi:MAG: ABC transporter ATP-binding protein [Planctomycetes bacterium]|nr:ABC transporter ATP-binding protein [Planctomycetota bacterium]